MHPAMLLAMMKKCQASFCVTSWYEECLQCFEDIPFQEIVEFDDLRRIVCRRGLCCKIICGKRTDASLLGSYWYRCRWTWRGARHDFAGRAGQFGLSSFLLLFILLLPFSPLCFNMLTIAVCSCLGMDVNLFFAPCAVSTLCYLARSVTCGTREAVQILHMRLRELFFSYMCVFVCICTRIKSVIHKICACVKNLVVGICTLQRP